MAPSSSGLGLFARTALRPGQALGEFFGPRLPLRLLDPHKRRYALQIPGTKLFIDGNWEHSIADGPRAPVVFARGCSTSGAADNQPTGAADDQPNGRIELWPILKEGEQCFRKELWLVAAEPISPGQEIRVDYAQLGAEYHIPPATPAGGGEAWRARRVATPGGGGYAPVLNQLRRLQRVQQVYTGGYTKVDLAPGPGFVDGGGREGDATLDDGWDLWDDGGESDTDPLAELRGTALAAAWHGGGGGGGGGGGTVRCSNP